MKSFLNIALLLAAFLQSAYSEKPPTEKCNYDNYQVYKVTPKTQKNVEYLQNLGKKSEINFWSHLGGVRTSVDVMVSPQLQNIFIANLTLEGIDAELSVANVQELIDNERPNISHRQESFGWTDYYRLDKIYDWLKSLVMKHPNVVTLVNAGKTYEGRDILGVHVSFGPGRQNKSVFIESNIHAREWISSAVATYVLNEILTSKDGAVRAMAESHDWYVFPVVNPDGFEYSHTDCRLWRKTRVPYGKCFGADPNRNWDYHYNEGGTSDDPCEFELYRGPHAFSEPSTKSLSNYISTIGRHLEGYISFHSAAQKLIIPYGYSEKHLDNYDDLLFVGNKAVKSLEKRYGTQFFVGTSTDTINYIASGGSIDWVKGTFGTPITYTYELRYPKSGGGFILPANEIIPSGEEVLDSLVTIFEEYEKLL